MSSDTQALSPTLPRCPTKMTASVMFMQKMISVRLAICPNPENRNTVLMKIETDVFEFNADELIAAINRARGLPA